MGSEMCIRDRVASLRGSLDNNAMHAKSGLRVLLEWMIAGSGCSGSVIADVITLEEFADRIKSWQCEIR